MIHKNLLKILFVEDLPSDAELAVLELRKEGLKFEHIRVDTRDEFIIALNEFRPDIVISDYMLPSYNGMQALTDARELNPFIPFILYTGSMNEETAVECIKAGATDYIIKEHMTRLPYAVKEALEQHRIKIEKRASDLLLKENEEKLQSIFSAAPVGIGLVVGKVFIEVNDTFCKMTGYSRKELLGKNAEAIYSNDEQNGSAGIVIYRHIAEKGSGSVETHFKCKDGRILNIFLSTIPLDKNDLSKGVTFIAMDITERVQAEEALANEKYLIYSLMSTLPDHIYFKDRHSRFIRINKSQAEFLGLDDPKQAVGKTDADFFTKEHADQAYEDEQKIIRTGKPISIEEKETHPNRPDTWVSTVKMPLCDKEGNIIGTFGISRDITERKLAEEALQKSQHLFKTLAQVSPVGIFRTDPDGSTTYVNPKWSELSGLSSEEALGQGWLNAVHPDDRGKLSESWVDNLKLGNESSAEYRFLRYDGSIIWVIGKAVPELIDNEIAGYIGTITNITERKLTEQELRESEEKYRRIFDNVQDLYYETSIDGTILEVSPSIEFLSKGQYCREDLIGISIYDFYSDTSERNALISQITERGTVSDFEITLKNKDGSHVPCSLSAKICFDTKGRPEKIIGSMHDITDRKNAIEALKLGKEKAESSDRLKTTFLNNISHEVRTPLNGILGFAEIMSQSDQSEDEKRESLSMLLASSDRLLNTITSYMDISLIISATMPVYKKYFYPGQVLRELFPKNKMLCSLKNLDLSLKIPEEPEEITICSDPDILSKVVSHLLSNAIKFTEKGSIQYGYGIRENELEFFIKDTGIGISKESLESIFEYFVKEDRGPLRISEGSGLGLSISKGFIELLGGQIRVETEIGKGSCFYFTIPSEKNNESNILTQTSGQRKKHLKTSPILVAEDDDTNFFYLNALLRQNTSAKIIHASNGKEAIEKFMQNPDIGLILMDIKMPVMDGLEATRQIKAINRNIPVIAITAYAMAGDETRITDAGCDYYLTKPINKKLLLNKLAEYINL
jgi:PAS domain S-box-containing protein